MKPKTKIVALIFGLILPYIAMVMYFGIRMQNHPLPTWFPYFGLSYMLGTIILVKVFSRKISRTAQPQTVKEIQPGRIALRLCTGYLVAVWSGLFVYGSYLTIIGHLEWRRSVPAGAFLLAFIGLFSRLLYSDIKRTRQDRTSPTQ